MADPLRLTNLPASAELVQSLLAVSHAPSPDQVREGCCFSFCPTLCSEQCVPCVLCCIPSSALQCVSYHHRGCCFTISAMQVLSTNVAGFILVKDVDSARGLVTYMAPCPGQLPGRYLVTGSLRSTID